MRRRLACGQYPATPVGASLLARTAWLKALALADARRRCDHDFAEKLRRRRDRSRTTLSRAIATLEKDQLAPRLRATRGEARLEHEERRRADRRREQRAQRRLGGALSFAARPRPGHCTAAGSTLLFDVFLLFLSLNAARRASVATLLRP